MESENPQLSILVMVGRGESEEERKVLDNLIQRFREEGHDVTVHELPKAEEAVSEYV